MQLPVIRVWFNSATVIMLCFCCLNTLISVQPLTVLTVLTVDGCVCSYLSSAQPTLFLTKYANFDYLGFKQLLAYLHLSAASPPNKHRYWWEVCKCVFYLRWVCNWYRLLVASLTVGINIVPILEISQWCLVKFEGERSGYCRSLSSLRAGTRHHGGRRARCSPA